jgi:N6-adenosine-specific RNA methylase IME4
MSLEDYENERRNRRQAYRTILADPPWRYGDKLRQDPLVDRGADDHYETMTVDEICNLKSWDAMNLLVAGFEVDDPAFLFLWVTNPFLLSGVGAQVCRAWGFEPKQLITWVKTKTGWQLEADSITEGEPLFNVELLNADPTEMAQDINARGLQMGMGRITRGVTEHIIVATRGAYTDYVLDRSVRNVLFAPRREHSRKPDEQYTLIERVVPGPYLELFATQRRDGWTSWGRALEESIPEAE